MMHAFRLVRGGLAIGLAFWIVDSAVGAYVFGLGTLTSELFTPDPIRLSMRLGFVVVALTASTYAQFTIERYRKAEHLLKISQDRLQLSLVSANQGLWDWNIQTGEAVISDSWAKMLNYEPGELDDPRKAWFSLVHPDEVETVEATMRAHMRGETPFYESQYRLKSKTGDYIWVLDKGRVVERDESGRALRAVGTQIDITKLAQTRDALVQSERSLAAAQAMAHIGNWDYNYRSREGYSSDEIYRILGIERQAVGIDFDDFIGRVHPDDRKTVRAAIAMTFKTSGPLDIEFRVQLSDSSIRYIHSVGIVTRDKAGKPLQARGTLQDITERKLAELERNRGRQELAESNSMMKLVLNSIPVRVFWKDLNLNYLGCNDLFAQDAGREHSEDLIGRSDFEMGWKDEAELYRADDRSVIESGTSRLSYEEPQTTPEGDIIWLRTSKIPLRNAQQELVGILGTYEDITEQKHEEQERLKLIEQVQKTQRLESLGVLAGGIAHDFNNILVGVLGFADLADARIHDDSKTQKYISGIKSASLRLAELCRHLLAYAGHRTVDVQPINLNHLLNNMKDLLAVTVSKKATLKFDLSESLPSVQADPTQLDQIVLNLVTNASESLQNETGTIRIATGELSCTRADLRNTYLAEDLPAGRYVYLDVEDDGAGMNAETLGQIFEPFFTTKFAGRGLGLAAVIGIVRSHSGALDVNSVPGKGTSFRILLPARTLAAKPVAPAVKDLGESVTGTVLLVDDEETVLAVASEMLTLCGYHVLLAKNGQEAIEIYKERGNKIDCVLLDLTMPIMDGEETFAALRELDKDVRVILASGYARQDVVDRLSRLGISEFLHKPFVQATLQQVIKNALAR